LHDNPCSLRKKDLQLIVSYPDSTENLSVTSPIEDIGLLILDDPQITISHALLMALNDNNSAILSCNSSHLPYGLMLPMFSHHTFTEKLRYQLESSIPLRKNLWFQTVVSKIENQATLLNKRGCITAKMEFYIRQVKSGDPENVEGRAAAYY
jgi:CRISPR-associated protein Cas1